MKKIILLIVLIFTISGCSITGDDLEGAKIYVTTYPIKYLVETLYSKHAEKIESIYPDDANTLTYELKDKQIKEYAKGDIFVYNGLTSEKNLAKNFINKNKNILIMDVSYGLSLDNSVEELWLSPNNYLMLAKNIKDNFNEYLTNKYTIKEVNENYNTFAEKISIMDADLRSIGKDALAKNKATLVVQNDAYKYLENYGFTVISLADDAYQNADTQKSIKDNLEKSKYVLFISDVEVDNEFINLLKNDSKIKNISLTTMTTGILKADYLNIMQEFIDNLRNSLLN